MAGRNGRTGIPSNRSVTLPRPSFSFVSTAGQPSMVPTAYPSACRTSNRYSAALDGPRSTGLLRGTGVRLGFGRQGP